MVYYKGSVNVDNKFYSSAITNDVNDFLIMYSSIHPLANKITVNLDWFADDKSICQCDGSVIHRWEKIEGEWNEVAIPSAYDYFYSEKDRITWKE